MAEPSLVGRALGPYRIEALLGEGAMGQVYRGIHQALGRPVAIKTLKPEVASSPSMVQRFFAEARAVNIIRHENIVECTDLVNDLSGTNYVVMELLEGRSLSAAIQEAHRLPALRAAHIAAQIADAIGAAHAKGIVHRDLKPDNVFLIQRAGSSDYVKVLDFGIARLRPEYGVSATQSGALVGTPAYMSPEQARGERVGPPADVYALGVVLFQMLSGRLPFRASSLPGMLMAHSRERAPRLDSLVPGVPAGLSDLVASMLEKEIGARPSGMSVVRSRLQEIVSAPMESNHAPAPTRATPLPIRVPVRAASADEPTERERLAVQPPSKRTPSHPVKIEPEHPQAHWAMDSDEDSPTTDQSPRAVKPLSVPAGSVGESAHSVNVAPLVRVKRLHGAAALLGTAAALLLVVMVSREFAPASGRPPHPRSSWALVLGASLLLGATIYYASATWMRRAMERAVDGDGFVVKAWLYALGILAFVSVLAAVLVPGQR